jgi:hypothetical protein
MRSVLPALVLTLLAVLLQACALVQGCPQIAEKSEGACRVGLPPGWYGDDAWRTQ